MPIVEVEWVDSSGYSGWQDAEDAQKNIQTECRSSGYLLRKDKKSVSLVQNVSDIGHVDMVMAIPRVAIKSIRILEKPRRGK
jgi:hypothetical protein